MTNKQQAVTSKRLPKGYRFPSSVKWLLREQCRTSPIISTAVILSDWLCFGACMCVGTLLTASYGWVWSAPVHVVLLWPLCSRFQRGLENLTHEATHHNFYRHSWKWNDRLGNWTCAYWVLLSVDMFRESHSIHHGQFGSEVDPDKIRFAELNIDHIPRSRRQAFGYLLHVLPVYIYGYWKQFSNKRGQFLKSVILHVLFATLISCVWYKNFWVLWLVYFWLPFVFYLPLHRFLAEAEEHRYQNSETEFEATFSNLGRFQRWFFHPHGDAYHLLHHLLPQIPHWKIARTHRRLLALDAAYSDGQYRTTLLESPKIHVELQAEPAGAARNDA